MPGSDAYVAATARLVEALDAAPSSRFADVVFDVLGSALELRHAWVYLADYGSDVLHPVPTTSAPSPPSEPLPVRGTLPGRVLTLRTNQVADDPGGVTFWLPVSQRGEAVGVLGLGLASADGDGVESIAATLGVLLGAAIVGARRRYDLLEVLRGAPELELEASIQWSVLAPTIHEEPGLEVAARVEPAYEYAGDAWDFSVRDGHLAFALFDAMGHGRDSALIAALTVSTYRWSRRRGDDLVTTVRLLDAVIEAAEPRDQFVTANLCELDLRSGRLTWLCAGHPSPLIVRGGHVHDARRGEPLRPLGLGGERAADSLSLSPGDAVLLYSDGVVEARGADATHWGAARLEAHAVGAGDPATPLHLALRSILDAVGDHARHGLRDDATVFAVRWHPADT